MATSRPERPDAGLVLHLELVRSTRGIGGLRLAIADGVERLEVLGGVQRLGFPGVDAYARERVGRSGRWVGDARTLARRLAGLPLLREAYLSGRLSTSKVELLARHLVRGDQSDMVGEEEAIALSASLTVRELRRRLGGHEGDGFDGERRRFVQLTRHVERLDAVALEGAIRLMEALGETTRSSAIEGLLAEGLTTLLNRAELAPDLVSRIAGWAPGCVAPHESATQDITPAEPDTDIGPASEQSIEQSLEQSLAPPCIDPAITDVGLLDLELRALSAELMRRDLRLGELALEAEYRSVAFTHGHRTLDDYYRESLGIAPSSMAARIALARRARRLPLLKVAIEAGAVGFETATLLARVATPSTEAAWLELADISTTKMFREHVDAAELHARANGSPLDALVPPTHEQIDEAYELERKVLSMVFADPGDSNDVAHSTDAGRDPEPGPLSVSALSEEAELGTVPLRLSLPDDLAAFWCDLEILHADAGFPMGTFVGFLVGSTLDTWRGTMRLPAYGDIYLRDRFRCQNPICRSRNCTPHHIVFRSHGGGDEPSNLVSLCDRCHLSLVHGGHLTVTGLAPHALHWSARAYHADSTNSMVA
jgi:hypothetical protein